MTNTSQDATATYAHNSWKQELWARACTRSDILRIAIVVIAYYLCARLGLQLQFADTQASPVWPPSGLALGALLVWGYRASYGVFLGALLANAVDFYLKNGGADASLLGFIGFLGQEPKYTIVAMWIALGNTAEALVGLYCIDRLLKTRCPFFYMRDVAWFFCIALLACMISASNGVVSLVSSGILPATLSATVWFTWWLGDAVGMFVLTPFLVLAKYFISHRSEMKKDQLGVLCVFCVLVVFCLFSFTPFFHFSFFSNQAYLLLPVLVVITVVAGNVYASGGVLLVSMFAIWGTVSGEGPFVLASQNTSLLVLQGFVAVIAFTVMLLDSLMCERRRAIDALRAMNATLERRVEQRTEDLVRANKALEQSNQELDEFCHIASHDLKEPLRGVRNQIAFLIEDFSNDIPLAARERIDKIPPIIEHLNTLISSLLRYSRVSRVDLAYESADLQKIVDGVLASLASYVEENNAEIRLLGVLPSLNCDGVKVGEVFRNLVVNAIKYNDKNDKWVEIGVENNAASRPVFFVRDNGMGIQERHFSRIFTLFKRLHAQDAFGGGTGIGMTIVKKIIERHGGEIWLESEVGVGTTFYFTLSGVANE